MLPHFSDFYSFPATLERFEERFAILKNETLGEFRWPLENFPKDSRVGDIIFLKMSTQKNEEEEKYARMRKLLEELIN